MWLYLSIDRGIGSGLGSLVFQGSVKTYSCEKLCVVGEISLGREDNKRVTKAGGNLSVGTIIFVDI